MLLKHSQAGVTPGTFTAGRGAGPPLLGRLGLRLGGALKKEAPAGEGRSPPARERCLQEKTEPFREGSGDPAWRACGVSGAGREMILEYGLQPLVRTVSVWVRTMGFCWLNGTL